MSDQTVHPMATCEPECTVWCDSRQHALQMMAAITGRPPADRLYTYCRSLCHNFSVIVDQFGRNALHLGASCGDTAFVRWLLESCHSELDVKDSESGWTALHRSLFYGQIGCAKTLIDFGANLNATDRDNCTPLDLLMLDRPPYIEYTRSDPSDCYVWGSNDNFNLGVESEQSRQTPEVINAFKRDNIHVKYVMIRKFHSMFLSNDGKVFSCGNGHGGRLGLPSEDLCISPKMLTIHNESPFCESMASGQDHLLLLVRHLKDKSLHVYSCGNNTYHVLGHIPAPEKLLTPQMISMKPLKLGSNHKLGDIVGIGAARYHSLFYTRDELFTFGLNVGQIGQTKGERLLTIPHKVTAMNLKETDAKLDQVVTSDGAIVCATDKGDVFVLHEYQCRKVASKQYDIQQICVVGGHLDERTDVAGILDNSRVELQIMILTKMRKIYLWKGSDPMLVRCLIGFGRELSVTYICLNVSAFGMVTKDGEVFFGRISDRKSRKSIVSPKPQTLTPLAVTPKPIPITATAVKTPMSTPVTKSATKRNAALQVNSFVTFIERDECHTIRVKKQPFIQRAVALFSDDKNRNFAALQASPKIGLLETASKPDSQMISDMKTLFETSDANDNTHDVVIKIGHKQYFCHKFILSNRSEYFLKKFSSDSDSNSIVMDTNFVSVDSFDQIIRFIYYNSNDLFENGKRIQWKTKETTADVKENNVKNNNQKKDKTKSKNNSTNTALNAMIDAAKKLGIKWLYNWLNSNGVKIVDNKVKVLDYSSPPKLVFDRLKHNLHDIVIRSEDGVEFKCHKCILMSRLEYFRGMFSFGWTEASANSSLTLPIPSRILQIIMDYIYRDESSKLESIEDPEFICHVLVIADQYLIPRLKTFCEYAVVNLLNLKNACELLELSYIYNAEQLRRCSLDFICINLQTLIETKSIDVLSEEALKDLTECYQNLITRPRNRRIRRYSYAPNAEQLEQIYSLFDASVEFSVNLEEKKAILNKRANDIKRHKKSNRQRIESNSSDVMDSEYSQTSKLSVSSPKDESELRRRMNCESEKPMQTIAVSMNSSIKPKKSQTLSLSEFQTTNTVSPPEISVKQKPITWGMTSLAKPIQFSMKDIISEEETKLTKITKFKPNSMPKEAPIVRQNPIPIPKTSQNRNNYRKPNDMSFSMDSNSPKSFAQMAVSPPKSLSNPWKSKDSPSPTTASIDQSFLRNYPQMATISMKDIVREEEEQIQNLRALQTKPLHLISIEDKAIEELLTFYKANANPDECITVERVSTRMAEPVWTRNQ